MLVMFKEVIKGLLKLIAITLLILMVIIILWLFSSGYLATMSGEFDSAKWDRYPSMRYKMVDDMEIKIDIWNLTRDEIIIELGTNKYDGNSLSYLRYYIGKGFLPVYYYIIFSTDGRVAETYSIWDL